MHIRASKAAVHRQNRDRRSKIAAPLTDRSLSRTTRIVPVLSKIVMVYQGAVIFVRRHFACARACETATTRRRITATLHFSVAMQPIRPAAVGTLLHRRREHACAFSAWPRRPEINRALARHAHGLCAEHSKLNCLSASTTVAARQHGLSEKLE